MYKLSVGMFLPEAFSWIRVQGFVCFTVIQSFSCLIIRKTVSETFYYT